MIVSTSYKSNHFLWLAFKVSIAFACLYFIYTRLNEQQEIAFSDVWLALSDLDIISLKNLCFLLIFSLSNWFFEVFKWKLLASNIREISWQEAINQTLSSLSFSMLTPNRIGEYGAKAYFFPKKDWKKVVVLNALGNGYQLLATLIFGSMGLFSFGNQLKDLITPDKFLLLSFTALVIVILIVITWFRKQWAQLRGYLNTISTQTHIKIGGISLMRYLIFSHQFCFVLFLLHPEVSYLESFLAVTMIYAISSCIPILSIFDLVVKGSVSIWVLSWIDVDTHTALISISLMWFFNFAIPSFLGIYYILTLRPKWS